MYSGSQSVAGSRRTRRAPRRLFFAWMVALLLALTPGLSMLPAHAEDPAELTISKRVTGWQDGQEVAPGEQFTYTVTITCTNIGSGGCTSAELTDLLPAGLSLSGTVTVNGADAEVTTDGNEVTVAFTSALSDPVGGVGIPDAAAVEVSIPVVVDDDLTADDSGVPLVNEATVTASNAAEESDDFTVVPVIALELEASTAKSFEPDSALAEPGTSTTLTLTGGNASNGSVERITMTDQTNPPGAFEWLGLTGELSATLPEGADQVQIDVFVDGAWVEGTPGETAQLPAGVEPSTIEGVRVHFISTTGDTIPTGASGSIAIELEQREGIIEGPLANQVSTTVTRDGEVSTAVTADDTYNVTTSAIDLEATKSFRPKTITVGEQSRVRLGATNTSPRVLDSLTITEPGGAPNMFENGLIFSGWTDDVSWPNGATAATVTFTLSDGSTVVLEAESAGSLPLPEDPSLVVGFAVSFTGEILPGAEAVVPFLVTAELEQEEEEQAHPNTVRADSTSPGGYQGSDTASDTLITVQERLAVEVDKRISPNQLVSIPGEKATVQLTGHLLDYPDSSVDAHQLIVTDPANVEDNDSAWWAAFAPTSIVATPVPANSTLTIEYWDGSEWITVPGPIVSGPQTYTADLPAAVRDTALGIRFIYESESGFPPDTTVRPNLNFELRPEMAGSDLEIENCAAADASAPSATAETAVQTSPCPSISLVPPVPGEGDLVDKDGTTRSWSVSVPVTRSVPACSGPPADGPTCPS